VRQATLCGPIKCTAMKIIALWLCKNYSRAL
jgi:hypothetical protein